MRACRDTAVPQAACPQQRARLRFLPQWSLPALAQPPLRCAALRCTAFRRVQMHDSHPHESRASHDSATSFEALHESGADGAHALACAIALYPSRSIHRALAYCAVHSSYRFSRCRARSASSAALRCALEQTGLPRRAAPRRDNVRRAMRGRATQFKPSVWHAVGFGRPRLPSQSSTE
jgi:hypothetical protein